MKKKRIVFVTIFVAALLLIATGTLVLVSFAGQKPPTWSERIKDFYHREGAGEDVDLLASPLPENKALGELTPYAWEDFKYDGVPNLYMMSEWFDLLASKDMQSCTDLFFFNNVCPVERIETVDADTLCAEYRLTTEYDVPDTFMYAAFQSSYLWSYREDCEPTELRWHFTGERYFVSRNLSSNAFASIGVGSTGQEIYEIDPAVYFDMAYPNGEEMLREEGKCFYSYRILTDGILRIRLAGEENPDEYKSPIERYYMGVGYLDPAQLANYTVTDMEFYPYGGDKAPELPALRRIFEKQNLTLPE